MTQPATLRRPSTLDLGEALAQELRRMIVRCESCSPAVMCEPCHTADRLLARYDEAEELER